MFELMITKAEPRPLTTGEQKLLEEALEDGVNRDRVIVLLLLKLGLTVKEVCALQENDVVVEKGWYTLLVREGNIIRRFRVSGELREALQDYLQARKARHKGQKGGYLFSGRKGRLSERGVYHIIKKYGLLAGLDLDLSPNILRYTFFKNNVKNM